MEIHLHTGPGAASNFSTRSSLFCKISLLAFSLIVNGGVTFMVVSLVRVPFLGSFFFVVFVLFGLIWGFAVIYAFTAALSFFHASHCSVSFAALFTRRFPNFSEITAFASLDSLRLIICSWRRSSQWSTIVLVVQFPFLNGLRKYAGGGGAGSMYGPYGISPVAGRRCRTGWTMPGYLGW